MLIKKMIRHAEYFFYKIYNYIYLKLKKVSFGNNLNIIGRIRTSGKNIYLGNHVTIVSNYYANPIGGNIRSSFCTYETGEIIIGNNVGISNTCICSMTGVYIDDYVLIGGNCKIYDTDFHSLYPVYRMAEKDLDIKSQPIHINKNVFIGSSVIILKGVTIGENAVVGAGSVVTKNIPRNEIWAGNPAKFIKKLHLLKEEDV